MTTIDLALNAATILLTEDRQMPEALSACRRGRSFFRHDYTFDLIDVADHLNAVELEADKAANLCANAGLPALAELCKRVANRISLARRQGTDDCDALADLSKLTTAGVEALDAAEEIAAEYSRV
jgi:hypothetical protein